MSTINLKCRCGAIRGTATDITPSGGNRVVCCCSDCQAFANHLDYGSETLDEFGGTDIYQTSQSQLQITQGQDRLQSLRLTKKGLLRWYASCCNTPIANTMNAKMPFVGIIHTFMDTSYTDSEYTDSDIGSNFDKANRESILGPVSAYVQTQHAIGTPDYPGHSEKFPLGITARIILKMLIWRVRGKHKPSAFFTDSGQPVAKPVVVRTQ